MVMYGRQDGFQGLGKAVITGMVTGHGYRSGLYPIPSRSDHVAGTPLSNQQVTRQDRFYGIGWMTQDGNEVKSGGMGTPRTGMNADSSVTNYSQ